ncbi:tautomerase family protein [Variovorax saccharolyticus]|uniref:tautomerase family protein n=1 Tax=Variovorax saccharolyticus TaxID=3053516 RepID=UPI002574D8D9|nr:MULTISPECIES: tautomerase family protein [unclassified Variovorax]MDM0022798.1 tautomerase family protein [Variovorax sp. J22R187]MDM0025147.1 tautomerase family protein [Variovorax sp. J31P216]
MPLYTIVTQAGTIDGSKRESLAVSITNLHVGMSGVPASWVHVVFLEYPSGSAFSAGRSAAMVSLTLIVRTGRSAEYKQAMLTALWRLLQEATAAPDEQIVIGIQEVAPSQAMEMGLVMPDVGTSS